MRLMTALVALLPLSAPAMAPPAMAQSDDLDARATALFRAAFSETCLAALSEDGSLIEPPQRYQTTMESSYGEPEPATLWQFRCDMGAYNLVDVFVIHTEFDGLRPLALPQPVLQVENENPEDFESPVKEIRVTSWTAGFRAINAGFDPATGLLSEASFWRGIGDASSYSVWVLKNGGAELQRFEADASYDGESAPQLVLEFP